MKIKLAILAVVLMTTASFAQMMSYRTSLKTSDFGITVTELCLIHRSKSHYKDIKDLGSRAIKIPRELNDQKLKMESYRFLSYDATPFEIDGTSLVPVPLCYDNETKNPRDDIFILTMCFIANNQ